MDPVWIGAITAAASWLVTVGVIIWRGGRSSATELGRMESRLAQTIAETARDLEARQDATMRMFGESVAAVRQQMTINEKETIGELHQLSDQVRKVEIWARDEFVRKDTFRDVCTRIEESVRTVNEAVQGIRDAILKMATNGKLDRYAGD